LGANIPIEKVILFDGVCNLCSASVQFIIQRDKHKVFRFASLQSDFARNLLNNFNHKDQLNTIILIDGNKIFLRSDAALRIAKHLSGLWPVLYGLKIIPRFIRDYVYGIIAKNRYKWFGKSQQCMIPSPSLINRFIQE
jgi:predicted DCC family thiol-disulfide oxidoreductase YuxK